MPRAHIVIANEHSPAPCQNCGKLPHDKITVITEKSRMAWEGCQRCWPWVLLRGQLEIIQELCRQADSASVDIKHVEETFGRLISSIPTPTVKEK